MIEILLYVGAYLLIGFVVGVTYEVFTEGGDGWEGLVLGLLWPIALPFIAVVSACMVVGNALSGVFYSTALAINRWRRRRG